MLASLSEVDIEELLLSSVGIGQFGKPLKDTANLLALGVVEVGAPSQHQESTVFHLDTLFLWEALADRLPHGSSD